MPPADRIATFDNDGTFWCEQPIQVQFLFLVDRVKQLVATDPSMKERQPFKALLEALGLNTFTSVLAVNSGQSVYEVMNGGPIWPLIFSSLIVSAVPALVAWWIGRHVLRMNVALLMGAVAGARQNTSSMQNAQEQSPTSSRCFPEARVRPRG